MADQNQDLIDEAYLHVLMVEFFRKANLPFVLVEDPKFQAMFQHLRPTVRLPSSEELIGLGIANHKSFKSLDKIDFPNDPDLARSKLVTAYAYQLNVQLGQMYSDASPEPSESSGIDNHETEAEQSTEGKVEPFLNREIKNEPVTDYDDDLEDVKPDLSILKAAMMPTEERKPSPGLMPSSSTTSLRDSGGMPVVETRPDFGPPLTVQEPRHSVKRPLCNDYGETKLSDLITGLPSKVPKLEQNVSEESQSRSGSEVSPEPSTSADTDPDSLVPLPVTLKRRHAKPNTLITFKQVPGVVRYPCIVCLQRQEPIKVRPVNNNDAYLMIYLCFSENMYTLDKARELARMQKFKVCVNHLSTLYDKALHFLNIKNPEFDVNTNNDDVVQAYHMIKKIKDCRYTQYLTDETSKKHVVPFCISLKKYFIKYCRKSYVGTTDTM